MTTKEGLNELEDLGNEKMRAQNMKNSDSNRKREMKRFVIVMLVFTIGMAVLLFYDVSDWWIWYLYFAVWTWIEYRIAKNLKLKWWHWTLIILAILTVDWIVLELVEMMKNDESALVDDTIDVRWLDSSIIMYRI